MAKAGSKMQVKKAKTKPFYRKCPHCSKHVRFMHYISDEPNEVLHDEWEWKKRNCHEDDLARIRGLCQGCQFEEYDGRMEWVDVCPNCYEAIR